MGSVGTGKYQHSLNCGGGFIVHPIRARRWKWSKYQPRKYQYLASVGYRVIYPEYPRRVEPT